jgi:hypothetical protein
MIFLVGCNAHKRAQALRTIPVKGVSTVEALRQEREKSGKFFYCAYP